MKLWNPALGVIYLFSFCGFVAANAQSVDRATNPEFGIADGNITTIHRSPALTGARRPLYRLQKSDVVEIHFTFSPEYDQTLTVQPDGYITLKGAGALLAEGLDSNQLSSSVREAYAAVLHEPEVTVLLKDFERPFFIAGGEIGHPGKYELRSPTTVSEGIETAGGFTEKSKHSQVVLFRRVVDGVVESHVLNIKEMLAKKDLNEDIHLKPGDMLFVPQNRISKMKKFLPSSSLSTFFSPAQF